jgi:FtsP/CotA-like multicopper oxidase with cupredoxin domain
MSKGITRRMFIKWGAISGAGLVCSGSMLSGKALGALPPDTACGIQETMPVSPFILNPFRDKLPIPTALRPGWRPDPTLPAGQTPWTVRKARFLGPDTLTGIAGPGVVPPGPALHQQDAYGERVAGSTLPDGQTVAVDHAGTHQVWPTPAGQNFNRLINWPTQGVEPIQYHIRVKVATHSFTTSKVRPINSAGLKIAPPSGVAVDANGNATLPPSTIYGFNGTFPGPMINAEYGKPVVVRFENDLDKNPQNLDRSDFGAPDFAFLTHLHNGHTAPESDGQPHYMQLNEGGYMPGDWVDNLYLDYPAGGDVREKQSFFWFHDHRMHFTGANVYKGMVGLFPIYDPVLDPGIESKGLRLPGVRLNHADGTFDVKYDIPMAFYDCALDDGTTPHADHHIDVSVCGATHPEQWGKTFFRHFPDHGFVGDVPTVNGTAFPVLNVFQRRYRFRFLDASVARIYELCLMTSAAGPQPRPGTQLQWQIPDGLLATQWTQIASMGGLLPTPILRDSVQIWPATRNEHVIDFSQFPQGTVLYLTNILEMPTGRLPNFQPAVAANNRTYKVPMVKIVVGGLPPEVDNSVMPIPGKFLRPMPVIPNAAARALLPHATFTLKRSGKFGDESQWVINDLPFDPLVPLLTVQRDQPIIWTNKNGGGGWVHPMHMHMEEHRVLSRVGSLNPHPDDTGKSDVTNLDPGESVTFYRNFRTFTGRYVAHCHNLAHEDHNMMFGWQIV